MFKKPNYLADKKILDYLIGKTNTIDLDIIAEKHFAKDQAKFISYLEYNRIFDTFYINEKKLQVLETKKQEFLKVVNELDDMNIKYFHIKGLNYWELYNNLTRQSSDFDIVISNINDYLLVHTMLYRNDYIINGLAQYTNSDGLKGIVEYSKFINDIEITIEVNIGGLVIADFTWLEEEFKEISNKIYINNIKVKVPHAIENLIILIVELSGRHTFLIRDIVDFYLLWENTEIQKSRVEKKLGDSYLIQVYNNLVSICENLILGKRFSRANKNFKRRFIKHVLPRLKSNPKKVCLATIYKMNLRLRHYAFFQVLIKYSERIIKPENYFNNGILVGFYQLDNNYSNPQFRKKNNRFLYYSKMGTFIATPYGLMDKKDISIIEEYTE